MLIQTVLFTFGVSVCLCAGDNRVNEVVTKVNDLVSKGDLAYDSIKQVDAFKTYIVKWNRTYTDDNEIKTRFEYFKQDGKEKDEYYGTSGDECEFCLCVDGEMFCYWQCPDEEEGEEEGGEPASTGVRSTTVRLINNTPATDSIASSIGRLRSTTQSSPQNTSLSRVEATSPHFASTPLDRATMNSSVETTESTDVTSSNTLLPESTTVVTSSEKTVSCFVLGK
ncbi:hypothetical protein M8J76_012885 [Diaphorina citri]|nr:hypothetical protein M8J76_012885 [Diaphorina citri]